METKNVMLTGAALTAHMKELERARAGQNMVHEQIAATAKGIAGEFWEEMATGRKYRGRMPAAVINAANAFYKAWPVQSDFIAVKWPEFINAARGALVILLNRPDLSTTLKDAIHEAIVLDGVVNPKQLSEAAKLAHEQPDLAKLMRRGDR